MEETGGTIEDYVRLNADYSNVNNVALLKEYYKNTKPHLDAEEVEFLLEDKFFFDEDIDDEREIKLKKLAFKDEISKAKTFLEEAKKKYYAEIKARPGVNAEQQKAVDFFNRYNNEQNKVAQQQDAFKKQTSNLFNNEFSNSRTFRACMSQPGWDSFPGVWGCVPNPESDIPVILEFSKAWIPAG